MDLYGFLKTIHMIGAALLFISLGFEAVAARRLRRAAVADRARRAFRTLRRAGRVAYAAAAAILIPGVWMMALRWGPVAWTVTALAGIAIMAAASFRARPVLARLDTAFRRASSAVPAEVPRSLGGALAWSLWLRASIAIGILVLMNTKPGWVGASATLAVAVLFGLAGALRSERRRVRPRAGASVPTRERQVAR
jgi:hypothetical protein